MEVRSRSKTDNCGQRPESELATSQDLGVKVYVMWADKVLVELLHVGARRGAKMLQGIDDLDVSLWQAYVLTGKNMVLCLDDHRYKVDRFPRDSSVALQHDFVVTWGRQVRKRREAGLITKD